MLYTRPYYYGSSVDDFTLWRGNMTLSLAVAIGAAEPANSMHDRLYNSCLFDPDQALRLPLTVYSTNSRVHVKFRLQTRVWMYKP